MKYEDIKDFNQRCDEHPDHREGMISYEMIVCRLHEEIEELRAYIVGKPAQEPVAWMYDWFCDGKLITGWIAHSESEIIKPRSMALNLRPLYTAPALAAVVPVGQVTEVTERGFKCEFSQRLAAGTKLYTAAPKENK